MLLLSLIGSLVHIVVFTCASCSFGECWLLSYVFQAKHTWRAGFCILHYLFNTSGDFLAYPLVIEQFVQT